MSSHCSQFFWLRKLFWATFDQNCGWWSTKKGMIKIITFALFKRRKTTIQGKWENNELKGSRMLKFCWHSIWGDKPRAKKVRGKQQTTIIEFSWLTLIFVQVLLLLAFYCVWGTHFPWVLLKKSIILQQQILVFVHKFGWYLTYVSGKFHLVM